MAVPAAVELVDLALQATAAYKRPDLATRLQHTRRRLADPSVRVLVVGEFKQGKSQLVNALVDAPVCPVDDDIATAVPTVVRYAAKPEVALVRESEPGAADDQPPERTPVPIEKLAEYVSEAGNPGNRQRVTYAEVAIPRQLLQKGLVLVDTPGVGGLGSAHSASTMAALPAADAVLLVSDASQEYTAPELDFLGAAMRLCPNVACVLTKIDLYPEWRRIADLNRAHLARLGIAAEVLPVSSTLRLHAMRTEDIPLMHESGFFELVQFLLQRVVADADTLDRRSTSQDILVVAEQLSTSFRAELSAQENPEQAEKLIEELKRSKTLADELRQRSARWAITLNDGVADLNSDVDYDLRDRLRQIGREAEDTLEEGDPGDTWEQFSAWLHQQVASAASSNFVWASQRARYLAEQVAEHFAAGGNAALPDLRVADVGMAAQVRGLKDIEVEKFGIGTKLLTGARGGYGGMLMFGMLTSLAGMALLNPLSAGAGLLLGGKTVKDEKKRQIQRRQMDAKNSVRKHIDDVTFQVGKDSRDMLRRMHRVLRDHFTTTAEELSTSLNESVKGAQAALQTSETQRSKRIADLKAELERIAGLEARARALVAEPVQAAR